MKIFFFEITTFPVVCPIAVCFCNLLSNFLFLDLSLYLRNLHQIIINNIRTRFIEISTLALITRILLRGATNVAKDKMLFFFCSCMLSCASWVMSLSLAKLLRFIAKHSSSKKRYIFLSNLKKILKLSLSVEQNFFIQKLDGEMLKTLTKANFC